MPATRELQFSISLGENAFNKGNYKLALKMFISRTLYSKTR